jgi:hypothetical protein
MARQVKCQQCEVKQPLDETMTFIEKVSDSGRTTKKYFHIKCLDKYEEKQAILDKEKAELDELVTVVGEIHELPKPDPEMNYELPRGWYHVIQDWRNGTQRYTRNFKKKYKKGIPYPVLTEAYKLSKDTIRWSKMDKNFKDTQQEMRYALVVVNSKINDAMKKQLRDQHMEKVDKIREEEELQKLEHERETVYKKKKKASFDISDLLD